MIVLADHGAVWLAAALITAVVLVWRNERHVLRERRAASERLDLANVVPLFPGVPPARSGEAGRATPGDRSQAGPPHDLGGAA